MSITTGYLNGPSGTGTPVVVATPIGGRPGTVTLNQGYWPADLGGILGVRPSFDGQPVPAFVKAGTSLTLPRDEVTALVAAGAGIGA